MEAKKFRAIGGPLDDTFVELEFPFRDFKVEEDGTLRHGMAPSDGEQYYLWSLDIAGGILHFAVHESVKKTDPTQNWALAAVEAAYNKGIDE